ncbi:hypothetical protein SAMD00019534_099450 [Acytostelium subglobosum LB1]|uniref:hypothetical protein n=1 Tax=Acytostelium subglobosum LB1 TaxID=1410327 RepID=UPI0006450BB6|nr:hypothetical protein SAMD00019534_099450 [Acytostelium subglobosum LB1]GAM26770.1 hypothetical protein SAMD00019534_099450 [Acytostelium subglobosum LB1]|eukprot:XP_012750431.1 hypothetical protein SAMD00019534_099450 [Acytostelium subglobosum LB1]
MAFSWLSNKIGSVDNIKQKIRNATTSIAQTVANGVNSDGDDNDDDDGDDNGHRRHQQQQLDNDLYDNNTLHTSTPPTGKRGSGASLSPSLPSMSSSTDKVLSSAARAMIDATLQPFGRSPSGCVVDHMVNLFGIGADTNCSVNTAEIYERFKHPIKYLKFKAFTSACAITDRNTWDRQYVDRVVQLARHLKSNYPVSSSLLVHFGKLMLSSIDKRYSTDGEELMRLTGLYVPNDYLMDIVQDFSELFTPCISIHPYRKDAVDELLKWILRGVRYVRWLPVSMGIDLNSDLCVPFYEAMVENDLILFVHTGNEHSLVEPPESDSRLGNPLLLRRPLDMGVKIVAVHCGGEGKNLDLDETKQPQPIIPNLHLFLRLMHEEKYNNNLIGDLSGIVAFDRVEALVPLMDHQHIHNRLIYGSDYPIPAVNLAVITTLLANRGLITPDERDVVNEIYRFNPILFDVVLKRILRSPITGNRFSSSIFMENKFFESSPVLNGFNIDPKSSSPVNGQQQQHRHSSSSPLIDASIDDELLEEDLLEEYTDF